MLGSYQVAASVTPSSVRMLTRCEAEARPGSAATSAQIAVVGAQGAVGILYRKELAQAEDPDARRAELIAEYEDTLANPYVAAERGYVDAVISPHETRIEIVRALRLLATKRETLPPKKHGNIPL